MSNPLRLFRKYQKRLMVFFGVLLMLSFVVGTALIDYTRRTTRPDSDPKMKVVKWSGGKVTRRELDYMKMQHQYSVRLLQILEQRAYEAKGSPQVATQLLPLDFSDENQGDRDIMRILMLARKAENMGMVVSENAVLDFLAQACDYEFEQGMTEKQLFESLIVELSGRRSDLRQITAQLQTELLAVNMLSLLTAGFTSSGIPVVTPVQALAYDARQYSTRRVQLVKFAVEDEFLSKVSGSPSDSELRELYDKGRFDFQDPFGIDPGFRKPRQLSMEWLGPNLERMRPDPSVVTEEEILERYNQMKDDPSSQAWEVVPATPPENENNETGNDETGETGGNDETGTDNGGDATGNHTNASDDTGSGDDSTGDDTTGDDTTGGDTTGGDTSGGDGNSGGDNSQSSIDSRNDTQFVSLAIQDGASPESAVQEADGQDGSVAMPMLGRPPRPPVQQPGTIPPTGADTGTGAQDPTIGLPQTRLKPLEEVRELIVNEILDEKAREIAWQRIEKLQQELDDAADDYFDWEYIVQEEDEDAVRPKGPDMRAWAVKNGFNYGSTSDLDGASETGLVNLRTFAESELAQYEILNIQYFQAFGSFPTLGMVIESTFDRLRPYTSRMEPEQSKSPGRPPTYIYWVTETKEPYSPEFDESKDDITRFWKMQKALELAKAQAQKVVDRADSNDGFLGLPETDGDVMITDQFPWMSVGGGNLPGGSGQLEISQIRVNRSLSEGSTDPTLDVGETLEDVGDDFMRDVFSIPVGEAKVVPSLSKKDVYAVFVIEAGGMDDEMLVEQVAQRRVVDQYAMAIAQAEQTRYMQDFLRDLEEEMELEWLVD